MLPSLKQQLRQEQNGEERYSNGPNQVGIQVEAVKAHMRTRVENSLEVINEEFDCEENRLCSLIKNRSEIRMLAPVTDP